MVNLPVVSREIAGKMYHVTTLSTEPGRRLWFKLVKLAGPALAAFLRQLGASDAQGLLKLKTVSPVVAAAALQELVSTLSAEDFDDFYNTFLATTSVEQNDGAKVRLESIKAFAFAGAYGAMVKWLGFCLEVNFGSFFDELGLMSPQSSSAVSSPA